MICRFRFSLFYHYEIRRYLFYENVTWSPELHKSLLVFYFDLLKFLKEIVKNLFYDLKWKEKL